MENCKNNNRVVVKGLRYKSLTTTGIIESLPSFSMASEFKCGQTPVLDYLRSVPPRIKSYKSTIIYFKITDKLQEHSQTENISVVRVHNIFTFIICTLKSC